MHGSIARAGVAFCEFHGDIASQVFCMMTLEYFTEGSEECPLIRLSGFEATDVPALREICVALAERRVNDVCLDSLDWVSSVGACRLTLRFGGKNRGVRFPRAGQPFVMECTGEGWLEVAEKLEAMGDGTDGFQWLTIEGDVGVLISRDGRW